MKNINFSILLIILFIISSCSSIKVVSDMDKSVDFSKIQVEIRECLVDESGKTELTIEDYRRCTAYCYTVSDFVFRIESDDPTILVFKHTMCGLVANIQTLLFKAEFDYEKYYSKLNDALSSMLHTFSRIKQLL